MNRTARIAVLAAISSSIFLAAACNRYSAGATVFTREKCNECHTIKGKGGAVGPNLTLVGNRRSREYIVQQIKEPSSHNPNTAMPSFKERLSEQDVNALADYLSNLK